MFRIWLLNFTYSNSTWANVTICVYCPSTLKRPSKLNIFIKSIETCGNAKWRLFLKWLHFVPNLPLLWHFFYSVYSRHSKYGTQKKTEAAKWINFWQGCYSVAGTCVSLDSLYNRQIWISGDKHNQNHHENKYFFNFA